jgi:hypothetical protein
MAKIVPTYQQPENSFGAIWEPQMPEKRSRVQEPSTYAGLSTLLALLGHYLDPTLIQQVVQVLAAIAGFVAVFKREPGNS